MNQCRNYAQILPIKVLSHTCKLLDNIFKPTKIVYAASLDLKWNVKWNVFLFLNTNLCHSERAENMLVNQEGGGRGV